MESVTGERVSTVIVFGVSRQSKGGGAHREREGGGGREMGGGGGELQREGDVDA